MFIVLIQDANASEEDVKKNKTYHELHLRRAEAIKQTLKNEVENSKKNNDSYVISFDLQQALPVPNLTVGPAFYSRKAWVYNLGIHDCVTGQGYMYMWPENVDKRGSDQIASIIYKHFTEMMCLWMQLVKEGFFKSIEHRFLVVGHTDLPCDRILLTWL